MIFRDPVESYESIFNPFRNFIEPILYVSSIFEINTIPNWYFIAETNYPGSIDCWINNADDLRTVIRRFQYPDILEFQWENHSEESQYKTEFSNLSYYRFKTIGFRELLIEESTECTTLLPNIIIWRSAHPLL